MLQPGGTILIHLVASHDVFDVFNQLSEDPRFASYIQVNILHLYISLICSYLQLKINNYYFYVYPKDKGRLVSPFQYSTAPLKEIKKIVRDIGFNVLHCSHRETTFLYINSHTFLCKYMASQKN